MPEACGGAVPELASQGHIRRVLSLTTQVLAKSVRAVSEVDLFAYRREQGLASALLVRVACHVRGVVG